MAKHLKFNIKNTQLAKAVNLKKVKDKLAATKAKPTKAKVAKPKKAVEPEKKKEEEAAPKRRIKARTRSAFAPQAEQPEPAVEEEAAGPAVAEEPAAQALEAKIELPPPVTEEEKEKPAEVKKAKPPAAKPAPPAAARPGRKGKVRDLRDLKPRPTQARPFDSRDRKGLRMGDDERWRKRRRGGGRTKPPEELAAARPKEITVRLPISLKDLAGAMKLKASELVGKLFLQNVTMTLNDLLDDETTVQLLGHEFGCEITIDTSEAERIRIVGKSIREEIQEEKPETLESRPPVVAFMGHVDHGKTSLIDKIRSSNRAAGEAGAITQHIGAFQAETSHGKITILDTPGHEAFTAMRARGAEVTDIVILVIAGDEGMRAQTEEAIQHAKAAGVTIIVAINKSDKPNFDTETIYRQLADIEMLPETWGGTTITVNCSAVSGEGVSELLEMIALQSEVLELKAAPKSRARGSVLESEMHKGMGATCTLLVQNGTLHPKDSVVFGEHWGRVKTMQDDEGHILKAAGPSMALRITGLSGVPQAGQEFVVVADEKEAIHIAQARGEEARQRQLVARKRVTMENLLQGGEEAEKKVLNLILRADVHGTLEALKSSLLKIESDKARIEVIFEGVGAISESDVELAAASKAVIIGFHTAIEAHAESAIKQNQVEVRLYDVIYKAIDEARALLTGKLEKVAQEVEKGVAEVRAVFKASGIGKIAGCYIEEGLISRNHRVRLKRGDELIWTGTIDSMKREKDDVREVKSGYECGIVLDGTNDIEEGDRIEAFEVIYVEQEL